MSPVSVQSSMRFDRCITEQSSHLQKFLYALPGYSPPRQQLVWNPSLWISFAWLRISYKWNNTVVLLWFWTHSPTLWDCSLSLLSSIPWSRCCVSCQIFCYWTPGLFLFFFFFLVLWIKLIWTSECKFLCGHIAIACCGQLSRADLANLFSTVVPWCYINSLK